MAVHSYSIEINSVNIYKFGSLKAGLPSIANKKTSLNILPQVREITIYESIFSHVNRCEIAVVDYIGLFHNFPLSGEEIIVIEYKNIGDDQIKKWFFATESISDITPDDKNRAVGFIIKCISIEALANNLGTIQEAFEGTTIQIARQIFDKHIIQRISEFFPSYVAPNLHIYDGETQKSTIVIPNLHPIAAIDAIQSLAVSSTKNFYTYFFFQNANGFNLTTLQNLTTGAAKKRFAFNNKYKFFSDEIAEKKSIMNNDERVISNLSFNKRLSSMHRLSAGYFNNNYFEINIAQKAIHQTLTTIDDFQGMSDNHVNTKAFESWAKSYMGGENEMSNRTKYVVTTQKEQDENFPVSKMRDRWGKDLISKIAMSQIDITAVIPGTNRFAAGDLFYVEIPEIHGFNKVEQDDLISGYFMITDVKHIIQIGGFQTTVLKLNKDSLGGSIDRGSKY